ncbi:Protein FAR-RED IMPAIRED RESPONSE 1 [Bienertia sinuspersici]
MLGSSKSKRYHALANQLNGFENIPFLLKDMHNVAQKDRSKEFNEHDCRTMFEYFTNMKEAHEEFLYSYTVDEANNLKDVVWVDARSWAAYLDFGDVVCVNATYITNRYELSFAIFIEVNQYEKSILLVCALIKHENSVTYKWVMRQWLDCMGGVQPSGIITNHSNLMANAIEEVLPSSRHRLCVWHILSKVLRKRLAVKNVGEFHENMKGVVCDSLKPEEFEGRWTSLIQSFKLEGNEWLNGLWNDRRRWFQLL